jgi:hypothetical protein
MVGNLEEKEGKPTCCNVEIHLAGDGLGLDVMGSRLDLGAAKCLALSRDTRMLPPNRL